MKTAMRILVLTIEMIAFAFRRADVANRPDYVDEDSIF